jgi:two-component system response regulator HydG
MDAGTFRDWLTEMNKARILIVHPEPSALALLSSMLKSLGHEIEEAANDRVAVRLMKRRGVDLMLAGVDPADVEALDLLSYMRRKHRLVPVILLFSSTTPDRAKQALRIGALAVLNYPVPATELRAAVLQALTPRPSQAPTPPHAHSPCTVHSQPQPSVSTLVPTQAPFAAGGGHHSPSSLALVGAPPRAERLAREMGIVGYDPSLRQAIELAGRIAATRTPLLIVGEPGTGRSLLARMIHTLGSRRDQPFVVFDNSAPTEMLAEQEQNRNRTGAPAEGEADWSSKLQQAHGGTLFLDEVAALPDHLQAQLLQALQEREPEGHGHHATAPDVRFLMSGSDNLMSLVEQGQFRQDLYHRISVVCLKLPPLRHRMADIEALAEYFRARFADELGKTIAGFTHDALQTLLKHDWPGNVRELEALIRRGVVLCHGARITSGHLASALSYPRSNRNASGNARPQLATSIRPLKEALEEPEKRIIIQALQALNWNRQETARALDINRTTLYKKMKKYGLLVDGPIWVN